MWWKPSPEKRFRRDKYAEWFACLDRNEDGRLERGDLVAYAAAIGERLGLRTGDAALARLHASAAALWRTLAGSMDEDGDGVIRLDELVGALVAAEEEARDAGAVPAWCRDHVMAMFEVLDVDGNGTISEREYAAYLEALGSEADAAAAFVQLDDDGDGVLSLEEIERHFTEWLRAGDPAARGNVLLTGRLPEP